MRKIEVVFSIMMDVALLGTWIALFLLGNVPELATSPLAMELLLVAECLTGLSLLVGGIGLLIRTRWGVPLEPSSSAVSRSYWTWWRIERISR